MKLNKLGEFGLIGRFHKEIRTDRSVIRGSGDDCAVLTFDRYNYQLFTCDMIVENVDFTRKDDPFLIGRKAVAVSLSDIASCCGVSKHCVISLGLPQNVDFRFVQQMFKGMLSVANSFKCNIVGGDISRCEKIVIDVSMLGLVEKKKLALRSGAKAKDIIFVSGKLGGSIRGKHLKFTPRLKEAQYLADNYKIGAMIDISDGLLQDLGHITDESRVGAVLFEKLIPVSKDAVNLQDALTGGEDFELLFTLPVHEAKKLIKAGKFKFWPVGEILEKKEGIIFVDKFNKVEKVRPCGFSHF